MSRSIVSLLIRYHVEQGRGRALSGSGRPLARTSAGLARPGQSEKGQLRALTVGRQKTRLRGSRHTNPRYPTRPKDIHLENLQRGFMGSFSF